MSKPRGFVAAIESSPAPCFPAVLGPAGEIDAATATSKSGSLYGRICRRAPSQVNQSVWLVTVSPLKSAIITSKLSSIIRRCSLVSMPSIRASVVS